MNKIIRYTKNTIGRDFVVGDVHGCLDLLHKTLTKLNFDEETDRLFSVGDLVDRGRQSVDVLGLLKKGWFYAVRGNHEQMAIDASDGIFCPQNYRANGGQWFMDLSIPLKKTFAQAFKSLPIAIEVETDRGLIGIIHADCPVRNWNDLSVALNGAHSDGFQTMCIWSRERVKNKDQSGVENIYAVVVGHTPMQEPTHLGNVLYIDTGAVYNGALTFLNLNTFDLMTTTK